LLLIIWYAWTWPRQEGSSDPDRDRLGPAADAIAGRRRPQ
jgi:hypothetical protein